MLQSQHQLLLIQYPERYILPKDIGKGRDPQVYVFLIHGKDNFAVLRKTALRDIKVGHDLDPGSYGCLKVFRKGGTLMEDAINAKPRAQFFLFGLQVNIGSSLFHCSDNGLIH